MTAILKTAGMHAGVGGLRKLLSKRFEGNGREVVASPGVAGDSTIRGARPD